MHCMYEVTMLKTHEVAQNGGCGSEKLLRASGADIELNNTCAKEATTKILDFTVGNV